MNTDNTHSTKVEFDEEELEQATPVTVPAPMEDVFDDNVPTAEPRVSPGKAIGISAAVGVGGVCIASVAAKQDASLSAAATPDNEKSVEQIAANIGIGDDVERVVVPEPAHLTVTIEHSPSAHGVIVDDNAFAANFNVDDDASGIPDFDNSCETLI